MTLTNHTPNTVTNTLQLDLNFPEPNTIITGTFQIRGWAFATSAKIIRVAVFLDDIYLGTLKHGLERNDVGQLFLNSNAFRGGFEGWITLPPAIEPKIYQLIVRATDSDNQTGEVSRTVKVIEPVFTGDLNEPAANTKIDGSISIRGWAFSNAAPVVRVEAFIGERSIGTLQHGLRREDVAQIHQQPEALVSGFAGQIPVKIVPPGANELVVRVTDANRNFQQFSQWLEINAQPTTTILKVDAPTEGTMTAGLLKVRGWAFSSTATIKSVYVTLNGRYITDLPYGLYRFDVREINKQPGALNCGFDGTISFAPTATGPQLLTIHAVTTDNVVSEVALGINVVDQENALAEIEHVTWRDAQLEAKGWAVWSHSIAPRKVRIFVAGKFVGQTAINLIRSDIAERFPEIAPDYGCGFHFTAPFAPDNSTDNTPLPLTLQFVDGDGRQFERTTYVAYEQRHDGINNSSLYQEFATLLADYQLEAKQAPTVLDWHTGLKLAEAFPEQTIFTPVNNTSQLPYAAKSVELVVLNSSNPAYLAEARRVASFGIVLVKQPATNNGKSATQATLQLERVATVDATKLPSTSIIIPVYNKSHYTQACLARLAITLPSAFNGEIIVVDDASSDDTPQILLEFAAEDKRIKVIRNAQNSGFIHSCNAGAAAATGEILVFLNNDTLPEPNWLPPLLDILTNNSTAGAVGGKLIYPDGTLQEAGGIIFKDASGANFGRGDKRPDFALYNYVREVDYCSGALLATPRRLFEEIGGFDTRYAPAYYEDTDYCFALRAKGYKVYYQPSSTIVHFEGISSGTDLTQGVKSYQLVNRTKFAEKWRDALQRQPAPIQSYDFATLQKISLRDEFAGDESKRTKRVLVCAPRMPEFDREGGSRRIFHALEFLRQAGWDVTFVAQKSINGERYARVLQQMGIATYVEKFADGVSDDYLITPEKLVAAAKFDLALLAFWPIAENWLPVIRTISPATRVIVDSIDFHTLRLTRGIFQDPSDDRLHGLLEYEDGELIVRELNTYMAADAVLTVSQKEADMINDFIADNNLAHAMPDREDIEASPLAFAERKGMVFIGNFRHPPNADAIKFLCQEILPQLDPQLLAEHPVYIVGNGLDDKIQIYAKELANIRMVGWVPSVVPYLQQARVSLIPLRNGAGTKRKLIQAMMVGTPSVSTTIGAEGLNLQPGKEVLIANNPTEFANLISQLLTDQQLWQRVANVGRAKINAAHGSAVVQARFDSLVAATMRKKAKNLALIKAERLKTPEKQ